MEEWLLGRTAFALLEPATILVAIIAPWILGAPLTAPDMGLMIFSWFSLAFQTILMKIVIQEPSWTNNQIVDAKAGLGILISYGFFVWMLLVRCWAVLQSDATISSPILSTSTLVLVAVWMMLVLWYLNFQAKRAANWRIQSERLKQPSSSLDDDEQGYEIPRWYSGVNEAQVDALVEECLSDPSINILAIPDVLEGQVYKITISLVLGLIYHLLGQLHGINILAHELRLSRTPNKDPHHQQQHKAQLLHMKSALDLSVLERIADRLLENSAVNQPLIPDFIERQLYINCLIIIFRLLDLISTSLTIRLCGHDFRLTMQPSKHNNKEYSSSSDSDNDEHDRLAAFAQAAESAVNLMEEDDEGFRRTRNIAFRRGPAMATPINTELLRKIAERDHGLGDLNRSTTSEEDSEEKQDNNNNTQSGWGWGQVQFEIQLQTTIFSLVLGIVDDLLENTQVELLSELVRFDIVAAPESTNEQNINHDDGESSEGDKEDSNDNNRDSTKDVTNHQRQAPTITHSMLILVVGFAAGIFFHMHILQADWTTNASLDMLWDYAEHWTWPTSP